jgi:hypothetical protein
MSDVKKDHNIGSGTGAMTGAVAGAAIGSAAGPAGSAVGAVVGGLVGAKAGDSIAEAINPTEYTSHFQNQYKSAPYYIGGSEWRDYEPAYKYGYDNYSQYRGRPFEEVEPELQRNWETAKGESRLAWNDARSAVRDGWHYIERAMPGDADRDGR